VCNDERNKSPMLLISQGFDVNTDPVSSTERNFSPEVVGQEEEMKSHSEQESKADGTILNDNSVITPSSAIYGENHMSFASKDDQISSKKTSPSVQVVLPKACNNSAIKRNTSALEPKVSKESDDVTLNSFMEEEKRTSVILEDKPRSLDIQTPNSVPWKVQETLMPKGESTTECSSVSVVGCGRIQKLGTSSPNELYTNRDEAQCNTLDNRKIHPIVEEKNSIESYSSKSPISRVDQGCNRGISISLQTTTGTIRQIQLSNSSETENYRNCPWNLSQKSLTAINIEPSEEVKSELARLQKKDNEIMKLALQNEMLRKSIPERCSSGKVSRRNSSSRNSLLPIRSRPASFSSTYDLLSERVRHIKQSMSAPYFAELNFESGDLARDAEVAGEDSGKVDLVPSFKFISAEEKARRSSSEGPKKKLEPSTEEWSGVVMI